MSHVMYAHVTYYVYPCHMLCLPMSHVMYTYVFLTYNYAYCLKLFFQFSCMVFKVKKEITNSLT
jgi:hypothetical protein